MVSIIAKSDYSSLKRRPMLNSDEVELKSSSSPKSEEGKRVVLTVHRDKLMVNTSPGPLMETEKVSYVQSIHYDQLANGDYRLHIGFRARPTNWVLVLDQSSFLRAEGLFKKVTNKRIEPMLKDEIIPHNNAPDSTGQKRRLATNDILDDMMNGQRVPKRVDEETKMQMHVPSFDGGSWQPPKPKFKPSNILLRESPLVKQTRPVDFAGATISTATRASPRTNANATSITSTSSHSSLQNDTPTRPQPKTIQPHEMVFEREKYAHQFENDLGKETNAKLTDEPLVLPTPRRSKRLKKEPQPESIPPLIEPTAEFIAKLEKDGFKDVRYKSGGKVWVLTVPEIARLQDNVFLDDTIVSFYLQLFKDSMDEPYKSKTHIFSTFFYPAVHESPSTTIAKWVAKVDIKKSFLVIPIHQNVHWSVVVVVGLDKYIEQVEAHGSKAPPNDSYPKPSVVLFDSMVGTITATQSLLRRCKAIVNAALASKNLPVLPASRIHKIIADVPLQDNLSDCGVFLIDFMRQIFSCPQLFLDTIGENTKKFSFMKVFNETFKRRDLLSIIEDRLQVAEDAQDDQSEHESDIEVL